MEDKKEKDELSFDFSKVKKFFKKPEEEEKKEKEEKEFSLNFKSMESFLKRYKHIIIPVVLIIFCMYLSFHYRIYSDDLPITDEWGRNAVYNFYKNNIRDQINKQYPNLPEANKNVLVEKQFQEYLKQNSATVNEQIRATSDNFKQQFKDDDGHTYLLAIDPYFYYRQTKNLLETGTVGDEMRDGVPWNTHMFAPIGKPIKAYFHHYFILYTYKIMHFFNRDISLMGAMFYVPIILSMLSVIPAFFIARKIGGNVGGFFAAFIVAVNSAFINRTAGGFADTDAYNVLFPLLIAWVFLEAFEAKDLKKTLILGALTGFFIGIFSSAWDAGWWYIFDLILIVVTAYIGYYLILHRSEIKNLKKYLTKEQIKKPFLLLVTFFASSALFVTLIRGKLIYFLSAFLSPIKFITIKIAAHENLWPNVYTTVAELNPANVPQIIGTIGGSLFFIISLIGIILTLTSEKRRNIGMVLGSVGWFVFLVMMNNSITNLYVFLGLLIIPIAISIVYNLYKKYEDVDMKYAFFLILWFLGTIYASTKGVRFILLLVPGFSVAFGIGIGKLYNLISEWAAKALNINKMLVRSMVIILILLLLINPIKSADGAAKNEIPSMNDGWYGTLTGIKNNASEDAIINSWWDFGHWFKAIADRPVTFDGASQNNPQAHWIGKVLMTDDEDFAIGILRMLDCGANKAFNVLNEETADIVKTIDILYEILPKSKTRAKVILKKYVSEKKADEILKLTHCEPPEDYFITSQDMVSKAGVWSHFGGWDFRRAKMWNNSKNMNQEKFVRFMKDEFNYEEDDAVEIYYELNAITDERDANNWISPWPGYASGFIPCIEKENDKTNETILKCQNGVDINLNKKEVSIPTNTGIMNPNLLGYMENDEFILKKFENNTLGDLSVDLIKDSSNNYYIMLLSPQLAGSMFTRLFYYEGRGLKHFDMFSDIKDVTGARIIVWKVDWEGK